MSSLHTLVLPDELRNVIGDITLSTTNDYATLTQLAHDVFELSAAELRIIAQHFAAAADLLDSEADRG